MLSLTLSIHHSCPKPRYHYSRYACCHVHVHVLPSHHSYPSASQFPAQSSQLPPPKPFQLPTSQLQHELNPPKAPQPRPARRFNTHVLPPDHITSKTLPHHPRVHNHSPHNGPQARMARHPPRLHRQTRREKLCARVRPNYPKQILYTPRWL